MQAVELKYWGIYRSGQGIRRANQGEVEAAEGKFKQGRDEQI